MAFLILVGVLFIVSFILMVSWNAVMPAVFGLPTLDYLQATALYVVSNIIFGAIRGGGTRKE